MIVFVIASLSKPLSSEAIVRLAARCRVSLDEAMAPWWVDPDIADDPAFVAFLRSQT